MTDALLPPYTSFSVVFQTYRGTTSFYLYSAQGTRPAKRAQIFDAPVSQSVGSVTECLREGVS